MSHYRGLSTPPVEGTALPPPDQSPSGTAVSSFSRVRKSNKTPAAEGASLSRRLLLAVVVLACLTVVAVNMHQLAGGHGATSSSSQATAVDKNLEEGKPGAWLSKTRATSVKLNQRYKSETFHGDTPRTFDFHLCNGYGNQVISFFHAAVVALEAQRTMVIPRVLMDGMQNTSVNNLGSKEQMGSIGDLWNADRLLMVLENSGISTTDEAPDKNNKNISVYQVKTNEDLLEAVQSKENIQHLKLGCPLLRITAKDAAKHAQLFFDLLAVEPNDAIKERLEDELQRIPDRDKGFNALHLRIENDWMRHCSTWNGRHTWECLGDYRHIGKLLRDNFLVDTSKPLFIITDKPAVQPRELRLVEMSLKTAGFQVMWQSDDTRDLPREARAILYYFLAMEAEVFIGNHVSTLSALLIIHRRGLGRGAIHYNKGSIPLGHFLPFYRVPWVFAANGVSGDMHDSMIKRSVESLFNTQGTLKPYCLYQGSPGEEMYKWLVKRGVTVLLHEPEWIDDLWEAAKKHRSQNNKLSHLYDKKLSIQSTFARIDMPLFKELSEYSYVIYTDNDIYFRGPIQLEDLAHKLPTSLAMSYEMADMFPYNAGIMVAYLPYLRETYQDFVHSILDKEGDFQFLGYGPGDQGAYNSFYRDTVSFLDEKYNAKLYKKYRADALIVHFHGPKPHQYMEQLMEGECSFTTLPSLCKDGLGGFCTYLVDDHYFGNIPDLQKSAESHCAKWWKKKRTLWGHIRG